MFCYVILASGVLFDVEDTNKLYMANNKFYVVNLEGYMCNCGLWQISDLPYNHAMACIAHLRDIY